MRLPRRRLEAPDGMLGAPHGRVPPLSLDADQRSQARDPSGEPGMLGGGHDRADVLVGAGRLLGDAAGRRAADQNALRRKIVDDLAAAPLLERGMARQRTAGAVAGGGEGLLLGRSSRRPECTSPSPCCRRSAPAGRRRRSAVGQAFVAGPEGAGRALAMNEQLAPLAVDDVRLDLAGIVRDIEQQAQVAIRERSARKRAARSGREFRGWRARN